MRVCDVAIIEVVNRIDNRTLFLKQGHTMQKLTLQADVAKSFTDLDQKVLVCDDTGKELGFFQPALKNKVESPLSLEEIEELRRRYIPGTGRTTEEVLQKWES